MAANYTAASFTNVCINCRVPFNRSAGELQSRMITSFMSGRSFASVPWLLIHCTSLAGLGNFRRVFAISLRSIVLILIVMALAEVQLMRTSQKVTVIYLLDQSESIPQDKRQAMLDYVVKAVAKHRKAEREDRAGVIVFGRNANIEIPPFDDDVVAIGGVDSYVNLRTDATNLETVRGLTIVPATTAGIANRVGSLEVGKDADFVILSGDPADPRTSVSRVFINGKRVYDTAKDKRRF